MPAHDRSRARRVKEGVKESGPDWSGETDVTYGPYLFVAKNLLAFWAPLIDACAQPEPEPEERRGLLCEMHSEEG